MRRWSASCIVWGPCLCLSTPAIGVMVLTPRLTGLWRSFIMLWADVVSVITIISFRPVLVANGLMGGGGPFVAGHIYNYPEGSLWRHHQPWTIFLPGCCPHQHSLWRLCLGGQLLIFSDFYWLGYPLQLGVWPQGSFPWLDSFTLSVSSGQMLVLMLGVSDVTVPPNFLDRQFRSTWLITTATLLWWQMVASLLMDWWNHIGRLWSKWPMLTLWRNKCHGSFGSMQLFTLAIWWMPFLASLVASWLLRFY